MGLPNAIVAIKPLDAHHALDYYFNELTMFDMIINSNLQIEQYNAGQIRIDEGVDIEVTTCFFIDKLLALNWVWNGRGKALKLADEPERFYCDGCYYYNTDDDGNKYCRHDASWHTTSPDFKEEDRQCYSCEYMLDMICKGKLRVTYNGHDDPRMGIARYRQFSNSYFGTSESGPFVWRDEYVPIGRG